MAKWVITKFDSTNEVGEWELPGGLEEAEVEGILRCLVSRDLSETEIINASRRGGDPLRNSLLDRIGNSRPIHFGENPYYVASFERG